MYLIINNLRSINASSLSVRLSPRFEIRRQASALLDNLYMCDLRNKGQGPIPNVYQKLADLFPTSCKFKTFLCSAGNRKYLQALIKTQLSKCSKSISQELVYSVGQDCVNLTTDNTNDCSQSEADTIMLSMYAAMRSSGYADLIVIDAEYL